MAKKDRAQKTDEEILRAYNAYFGDFRDSEVVRKGITSGASFHWTSDSKLLQTETTLDQNAFIAFCVLFRPLWLRDSPQKFETVVEVLRRQSLTDPELAHVDKCVRHWETNLLTSYMHITPADSDETWTPAQWIDHILSEIHHPYDREDRREVIDKVIGAMGPQGWLFIQVSLLPSMKELLKAATGLHEVVKLVLSRSE